MVVYKITNMINGKVYIGQTKHSSSHRFDNHFRCVEKSLRRGHNVQFNIDLKLYGKDGFIHEEIDHANSREVICEKEKYWIAFYNSTDPIRGYNRDAGGQYGLKGDETKKIIGQSKKRDWQNKGLRDRMSDGLKKATQKWVNECEQKRVEFICPVCNSKEYLVPYVARQRTYCSSKCSGVGNLSKNLRAIESANKASAQKVKDRDLAVRKYVLEWTLQNQDLILNTPYNKTNMVIEPLAEEVFALFGVKDARVIGLHTAGVSGRKELLRHLKEHIRKYMLNQSESTEVSG